MPKAWTENNRVTQMDRQAGGISYPLRRQRGQHFCQGSFDRVGSTELPVMAADAPYSAGQS
jgi:hypothetical protein